MKFEYGINTKKVDITDIVYNKCLNDNNIIIPKNDIVRRDLFGIDPCPKVVKFIYINGCPFDKNTIIKIDVTKKICLCFYGLTRSLRHTQSSINKHIIKILVLNNYYIDIYLHTYDLKVINNKRAKEFNIKLNLNEYKLLNPDYFSITSQNEFDNTINIKNYLLKGDPWKNNGNSLFNLLRQLNSLKIVTKMHEDKDYKCYIYLRPDLKYLNNLDINLIKNLRDDTFYTPKWGKFCGLNDRLGFGSKNIMVEFGYRLDKALEYSKIKKLHSESFLKYIMEKYKINNINLKAHRIRANGQILKDC
jgi:hypothetical protein